MAPEADGRARIPPRPRVSVIVPFLGDAAQARETLARLGRLELRDGDEVLVADNTPEGVLAARAGEPFEVVRVADVRSASHARNAAAGGARGEWLWFTDADCVAPADILSRLFAPPPGPGCGVVAGEVVGDSHQRALLARWARSRRGRWVQDGLGWGPHRSGVTANLLVSRAAFESLGGFRIGGGGDLDLCWRLQEGGWAHEHRPDAVVWHRDRETLGELATQGLSYGSHRRRLRRLHGPSVPTQTLLEPLLRALGGAVVWMGRGEPERAAFKLIDGFWAIAMRLGEIFGGPPQRRAD